MTEIADVVQVTVNVRDTLITRAGFGTPAIFAPVEATVFAPRFKQYGSITEVAADFADTTKVYKAAAAIFAQQRHPPAIKIVRREAGDASHTSALNAIVAEDSDWYGLVTTYRGSADITEIAAWIATQKKIFVANSEDADVPTAVATDIASLLEAQAYDQTAYMWHHQSGVDVTGASYTVSSGVATITETAHGLRVGEPVTFSNSSGASIDGNNTIATVPDANSFTVTTTAADEAGPATVDYLARYTFPEAAWVGYMLPSDPGSETWKFKELTGIVATPKTILSPSEEATVLGKNANVYTPLAGVGHTHEGVMASGRFIDVQRGIHWTEARLGEAVVELLLNSPKIPYTDAGLTLVQAALSEVMDLGIRNGLFGPLLDESGDFYRITIPKVADQLQADRVARYFPGITIQAQLAGAVHSLAITVNAQI